VDSFDYRVVISGHLGSYGNETNRFLRSLRSVEMTLGDCRGLRCRSRSDPIRENDTLTGQAGGEEFLVLSF